MTAYTQRVVVTRRQLTAGDTVIVRDAMGRLLWKVATSRVERGCDFAVVRVRWADGVDDVPWPFEDVWHADGEPVASHMEGMRVNPADALSRAQYTHSADERRNGAPDV